MNAVFLPHANLQYSQLPPERRGWVVRASYEALFDLLLNDPRYRIGFEASGETLDVMAEQCPDVLEKLRVLLGREQVEAVGSPHTHIMLSNMDPVLGLESLKHGRETWEKHTGIRPQVGWNPECSWAWFIPEIFSAAGFESLIMDGDSFFLSFAEIREATGLSFDVRGHSNKSKLFAIEEYIKDKPQYLRYLTNPSVAPNGLKILFRSDCMANPLLWFLMGATEGHREKPVAEEEVRELFHRWSKRVAAGGSCILPYAEDAEYIGTSAYFYVKQFGQARFFEPEPESVTRFKLLLDLAIEEGFTLATPSTALEEAECLLPNGHLHAVENGIAWHGGTAKAWANTPYARIMDPVCASLFQSIQGIARHLGISLEQINGNLRLALRKVTSAYVSDSRWPPAPTSPGRFNVEESLRDLEQANDALCQAMRDHDLSRCSMFHSHSLMRSQIASIRDELMNFPYFGEVKPQGKEGDNEV